MNQITPFLLIGLTLICIVMAAELWHTRVVDSSQMAYISELLEQILQNRPVSYVSEEKDTLYGKILVQIKRIDEIKAENNKALLKERDSIKQLLTQIAHQLRTPLANMENYLVLLEEEGISEEERLKYINAVEKSERKISFLVEKFMLSARLESQIIQIHKSTSNLKETVAQAIFQVYKKAQEKDIYIDLQENENDEWMVLHDKNWICECVYNLLDNSIKYSKVGQQITVSMKNNEMFTQISVEDNGIGISQDEENRIFKLYYRGKNTTGYEGYGIEHVTDAHALVIINKSGMTIRLHGADMRVMGRATQGVKLINLEKRNDEIASVCKVMRDEEAEAETLVETVSTEQKLAFSDDEPIENDDVIEDVQNDEDQPEIDNITDEN